MKIKFNTKVIQIVQYRNTIISVISKNSVIWSKTWLWEFCMNCLLYLEYTKWISSGTLSYTFISACVWFRVSACSILFTEIPRTCFPITPSTVYWCTREFQRWQISTLNIFITEKDDYKMLLVDWPIHYSVIHKISSKWIAYEKWECLILKW